MLTDASVLVYRYQRRPLLFVQINTEQNDIKIFYVFKRLNMSKFECLTAYFLLFQPKIG
jgi:hypothetical protein